MMWAFLNQNAWVALFALVAVLVAVDHMVVAWIDRDKKHLTVIHDDQDEPDDEDDSDESDEDEEETK